MGPLGFFKNENFDARTVSFESESVVCSFQSANRSYRSLCKEQRSESLSSHFLKERREQMSSFTKSEKSDEEQLTLLFWHKKGKIMVKRMILKQFTL